MKHTKQYFLIAFLLMSIQVQAIDISLTAPNSFVEVSSSEREFQDCVGTNTNMQCPAGSPTGYTCQPVGHDDFDDIFSDSDPTALTAIRKYILGQDSGEAVYGRNVGETCSTEKTHSIMISSIKVYDQNGSEISPPISKLDPTPQISHPTIYAPVAGNPNSLQTLNLGCKTNRCAKNDSIPAPVMGSPDYNRYVQYQCQPRQICRCIRDGEALPSTVARCCEGLINVNNTCTVDPAILEASTLNLDFIPDHVSNETGAFTFLKDPDKPDEESPAVIAMLNNIVHMKALEWFSYNQTSASKCLPDHVVLKELGQFMSPEMQRITAEYNEEMDGLQELKEKYIQYSKQISDPQAFFRSQGSITYRGKTMTEQEFEIFVRNSTGGSEIFNIMADEQAIQLKYEYKVAKLLEIISSPEGAEPHSYLQRLKHGFASHNSGSKPDNMFGKSFGCRKYWIRWPLWWKRKLKKRWKAKYVVGPTFGAPAGATGNYEAFNRDSEDPNMMFFEGFMNRTWLGQKIFNKGKNKIPFNLIEPLVAGGTDKNYGSFGSNISTWGSTSPRRLSGASGLDSIKAFYEESINKYFKEKYFDEGHEIIDVAYGGLRVCVDSNEDVPFQIKTAGACRRYKQAMDMTMEAGFSLFLQASYGRGKLYNSTLNSKSNFYLHQQQASAELMEIYNKLSSIPETFGGLAFLDQEGIDFKAKFDEINDKPAYKGFLRLKSYLFNKARAQALANDNVADTGLNTGTVPDIGNIYGTPAQMINPAQLPQTSTQNLETRTAQLRASNNLATRAALNARNREDFLAINKNSRGSIAGGSGNRRIAKLNEKAKNYKKQYPQAAAAIAKAQARASDANKKISSAIGSTLAQPATGPLPKSNAIQSLSKKDKDDKDSSSKSASVVSGESYAPNQGRMNNNSVYNENTSSSSGGNNSQLTSLSDYELGKAIQNVENQPHLFKSDEDDSIFSKISKTYARSYDRFLVKRRKNSSQRTQLGTKKKTKVKRLLDDI